MTDIKPPPHPTSPRDDWQPAQQGEVLRLTRTLRGRKQRRQFLKAGASLVVGLVAVGGTWWAVASRPRNYHFAGMTCTQVMASLDAWKRGQLAQAQVRQLKQHVLGCPNCKPKFEQMGWLEQLGVAKPASPHA